MHNYFHMLVEVARKIMNFDIDIGIGITHKMELHCTQATRTLFYVFVSLSLAKDNLLKPGNITFT